MVHKLLLILFLGFFITPMKAQIMVGDNGKAKERIERFRSERIKHIKSQVSLDENEIQKLSEILQTNDTKKFKIWAQIVEIHKSIKAENNPTEDKYSQKLRQLIDLERNQMLINEELVLEIQKNFTPEKSYYTYVAIKHFYSKLKSPDKRRDHK
ncbi:hypothetical protein [Porphyromonas sp.]|uniref:hypothetical protein n=1 Tax=Porphyromonas sp. TaxID=1924944 RepID=UPI0026DB49D5|nr:hypothetical protein [Porphyromonas sp.]MDO4695250.1 hypothetical protein [Porphyromonas sp.]MDO4771061.1 hypothetical protein [Porphyromonas sp.]